MSFGAGAGGGGAGTGGGSAGTGGCSSGADCDTGVCSAGACVMVRSCLQIQQESGKLANGAYRVDVDDSGPLKPILAQCDFAAEDGGWTLVLDYVHRAGTNPPLSPLAARLPLSKPTSKLGDDESGDAESWGHAAPALLTHLPFAETRWYARTSAHTRVVHFRNDSTVLVAYLKSGKGGICAKTDEVFAETHSQPCADHSAHLPQSTTSLALGSCDRGDQALTEFPFFTKAEAHWGIRGEGARWEADDSLAGDANDTIHRVWVR